VIAVTFDYGQTLAELDTGFLAGRVTERGANVSRARLDEASPAAWQAYDAAKRRGETGRDAWASFMTALLAGAGVSLGANARPEVISPLVDFLWSEQPRNNLWRRAIAGMSDLCAELAARGVRLGIVSNSEGRLAELLDTMDLHRFFPVVADSGVLGVEKPDARIFEWTAAGLEVTTKELIHVGDAWAADVEGALGVGARAIWVTSAPASRTLPEGVVACTTATEIRTALAAWGVF
jgi:HAD superfamily hydrolase (TIGR01549 family)